MQRKLILIIITFLPFNISAAQEMDSLSLLQNYSFKVHYSFAHRQRAEIIAERIEKALRYNQQLLNFTPVIEVYIVDSTGWNKYIERPVIYGMPHYINTSNRLMLAATDNPFWKSFIIPMNEMPVDLKKSLTSAYTNSKGELSMEPFFDLLAIHELGHAFHYQAHLKMQRNWMSELFVNILLHTYIAENEKENLPALTLFPQMVISSGSQQFRFKTLADFQKNYDEIAMKYPQNYGWFQCRFHSEAAKIYNNSGKQVCIKLWNALHTKDTFITDEKFAIFLEQKADRSISEMIKNWDLETKK